MNKQDIDMSIVIKRCPENQTYEVRMVVHKTYGAVENVTCQTLPEMFQRIAEFERKLPQFQNAIEYKPTDWRELARENRAKAQNQK